MSSRTHVEILGVQIPLVGLAFVTSTPPCPIVAAFKRATDALVARDWEDILGFLKDPSAFQKIAERKVIPIDAGRRRQLFQYHTEAKS